MRKPCGTTLLKEVTIKNGAARLYPHKIYCYQSVVATLEKFVKRNGFTERCELWRNRDIRTAHQIMCDVCMVFFNECTFLITTVFHAWIFVP